jgi:hypothetical protein
MIKFYHDTEKAKLIMVNIEGDVQKYALSFLHIWNNARENPHVFYKVENCFNNHVFVTFNPDEYENVREYLENFGKIVGECNVNKVNVSFDYDADEYETLYPDDCDETDFFIDA